MRLYSLLPIWTSGGNMITGKEKLLEALIEAFIMEKGTNIFYKEAAGNAVNEESKKMFGHLAGWEADHMYYIQFLYQSVHGDTDMVSFEKFRERVPAPSVEGGMPVRDIEKRIERHEFATESDAIKVALEIEGKSYNLYRKFSEAADDGNAKVIMREMMEQEQKHINYIKELRAKLA